MTSTTQTEQLPKQKTQTEENPSDMIFTVVGLFMVMLLVWFTIKGKLRDWLMK